MEVEFPVRVNSGISTEGEVRWWYVCTAEEVEWKGSTTVRYLILLVLPRPYTLECTLQALVSDTLKRSWFIQICTKSCKSKLFFTLLEFVWHGLIIDSGESETVVEDGLGCTVAVPRYNQLGLLKEGADLKIHIPCCSLYTCNITTLVSLPSRCRWCLVLTQKYNIPEQQ